MPNDFSNYISMEDFAQIPFWAKSQARDPKVTRALVSTSSQRSDLLRSVLKPRHLIHCYTKPGFGLEPWLTRFLATLPNSVKTYDIVKLMQSKKLCSAERLVEYIYQDYKPKNMTTSPQNQHKIILIRLDRMNTTTAQSIIFELEAHSDSHTLLLSSTTSPEAWLSETRFYYESIHFGETQLGYSIEDYEKLTTRWPSKPSIEMIETVVTIFDNWPEPCLRSLCDLSETDNINIDWLSGHQWISTFLYSLPLELLQIMLIAHAQPVISPEGLDLCDPSMSPETSQATSLHTDFYDPLRRHRNQLLTTLCNQQILQQFTHPHLHFRWNTKSIQTVLSSIAKETRQLQTAGLRPPQELKGLTIELCKLYMEHDYIQEIVELCHQLEETPGLTYLMKKQPGRIIDYLRGNASNVNSTPNTVEHTFFKSNWQANALTAFFKTKFYWSPSEKTNQESIKSLLMPPSDHEQDEPLAQFQKAAAPIFALMAQYELSRNALSSGQLADGLVRLEHVFQGAVDEHCFSVAAPSIALIGLTDFFCINKKHLRKILQSIDHTEALFDPQTHISLVDWTDTCASPLQIISSHGPAIAKRLTARAQTDYAGKIPEEAYLFQEWIHCLSIIFRGSAIEAQQQLNNSLTRITTHYRQLQEHYKQHSISSIKGQNWTFHDISPSELLRPWVHSFLFIKLLNDIQILGKPTPREAQNLLKQYEQFLVISHSNVDQKDMWQSIMHIITLFLKAIRSSSSDAVDRLEQVVIEAKLLGFRLVWLYGSLLLSAALWGSEKDKEEESLHYFYEAIEFAETNALQDALTPLTDILHPQIRRAKQKNKAILLISRALDKMQLKSHRKNNRLEQLSKRELEILTFINQGMSNEDIAEHLCRAKGTVKLHVHNIYKKLEIRNRVEAIQLYNQYMASAATEA